MKLGADGIYVELAGEAYELRPSLRASMRLVRRHGLHGLFDAVQAFNVTIIMDMLRETAIRPNLLLAEIAAHGLGRVRHCLTAPLAEFVLAIAGIDPNGTTPPEASTGKPANPEQVFAQLYGIGTGWLGWTPEQTWNATPAEIIAAKTGRTDLIIDVLRAVFGSTEAEKTAPAIDSYSPEVLKQIEEQGHDPAFNRSAYAAFKAKVLS
ncbi:hypothetical protein JP75_14355 [Devosia riboflavina]|uniref:Uncharacterized protein n=1 Tax=Devosia riboflavina TaxID=46914 RepID=A0A087M198_9HYPH|nr:phage tail assembly chaperone [Devosia riboflavina]KFL30651.1 hypothetical protein JP75_14355 [Devosia riboflavina]